VSHDRLWTLPNVVSLSRLALAVAFVLSEAVATRLVLVGVATTTDYLDGWLARRRGEFSRLGALIDAGTDRAFVVTAVATLAWRGALGSLDVLVFLSRDLATAAAYLAVRRIPALRGYVFVARFPGKVLTVLQLLTLAIAILAPAQVRPMTVLLAAASVVAIADYGRSVWRARTAATR
jgi:cardiolipin synthase